MRRFLIALIAVLFMLPLSACGNFLDKSYDKGTDFGGEIALTAKQTGENPWGYIYSYFCIDKTGAELFPLPENLMPATDDDRVDVAPVNNYIFVTDIENPASCRYVLDNTGEIVLSPETGGYDDIILPKNYREMFCDGYMLVYGNHYTYNSSKQFLSCFDLSGNLFFGPKMLFEYDITEFSVEPYYVGEGILFLCNKYLDLKSGTFLNTPAVDNSDRLKESYDFTLQYSEIVEKAVYANLKEEDAHEFSVYKGRYGVSFHNWDNGTNYISIATIDGQLLFEPFAAGRYEKICVHDQGFIIVPDAYPYTPECDIPFYDFKGNLIKTVRLSDLPDGALVISDFSCGFFKIEKGGKLINYMDCEGNLLF